MRATFTMTARGALTGLITLAAAGVAGAQDADRTTALAEMLQAGVPCTVRDATHYLSTNVDSSAASTQELITALRGIALDLDICAPIRSAASEQAGSLSETGLAADPQVAALARERIAQTFQEAERHAGTMRFEVGPPPRNLTRGNRGPS
jgi:hypothetical protein